MDTVQLKLILVEDLSEGWQQALDILSPSDRAEASRYLKQEDQVVHLLSAYLKRRYVGEWTVGEDGKPRAEAIRFNVSHTSGAVVIALSPMAEVGVDVERVRAVGEDLSRYVTTQEEYEVIAFDTDFYRLWTAKESLVKAGGWGVDVNPRHIPSLPLEGAKTYRGRAFWSRQLVLDDLVLSVTREGAAPFEIILEKEIF